MLSQFFHGIVTDNKDPDSLHRIRVSKIGEEDIVTDWISVITPYAGNNAGFYSLPDIDEQVLVLSLDSDGSRQVVLGSLWTEDSPPPATEENGDADLNKDGKNTLHFLKSTAGNMIILDDTAGKEKIQLITSKGKTRIDFSVEDKMVTFETDTDISIGAKGCITIQAEEINMTAKKAIALSGDEIGVVAKKKLDITADQDITIKGSAIALN